MTRRGFALLSAVVVLAALGIVSTTALALARWERHAGAAALAQLRARAAADGAIATALQGWPRSSTPVLPGQEVPLASFGAPGPSAARASLRALGGPVYAIVATGTGLHRYAGAAARAAAELLIRLDSTERFSPGDSLVGARIYPRGWRRFP